MKKTGARAAALIACLALLAILLGSLSSEWAAPISQVVDLPTVAPPATITRTQTIETGTILVRALLVTAGFHIALPISNASVKIQSDALGAVPIALETNSSGQAEWQGVAGNYTLTVSDPGFSSTAGVQVHGDLTTHADLTVNEFSDKAIFSDLSDEDSSGLVAPWQTVVLAVNATSAITNSSAPFLGLFYEQFNPETPVVTGEEQLVPATIVSSQVSGTGDSSLLWLTMHPGSSITIQGIRSLALVTYSAVMRIS